MRDLIIDATIIVILIVGISQFRTPSKGRIGNLIAALAVLLALMTVVWRHGLVDVHWAALGGLVGAVVGWIVAMRVNMLQIPAMIAFQHGAGGIAAFLIAYVELVQTGAQRSSVSVIAALLGLIIGAATFSGSMIAGAKLANKLRAAPARLPWHGGALIALGLITLLFAALVFAGNVGPASSYALVVVLFAGVFGALFAVRIGGADMPVLFSFLNASAGLAAAFCGVAVGNRLLIACGAAVAASGSILTHIMCRAMNRSLRGVFGGIKPEEPRSAASSESSAPKSGNSGPSRRTDREISLREAAEVLKGACNIVLIPGYGMALAQAQFKVVALAKTLEKLGKTVKFAVHPVAGRMPGHMNVLLAEAELEYEKIFEMEAINGEFSQTDVAMIVGACDVVNPSAITVENSPISGMPILCAYQAKSVIVCNLDDKPGYSGVKNPLYESGRAILLWGDAGRTVEDLIGRLSIA